MNFKKKKRLTRLLPALALSVSLFCLCGLSAHAESTSAAIQEASEIQAKSARPDKSAAMHEQDADNSNAAVHPSDAVASKRETDDNNIDLKTDITQYNEKETNDNITDNKAQSSEANVFEMLYELACEHISEIMCAMTLAGSLVLTLLYKKGLMPFMTRTVGAIGSTVAGLKASTDTFAEKNGTELEEIKSAVRLTNTKSENFAERLSAIEGTLEGICGEQEERKLFKSAIECQSTLLYEVLMHSSIPQYQKDAVGDKLGKIKAQLKTAEIEEMK